MPTKKTGRRNMLQKSLSIACAALFTLPVLAQANEKTNYPQKNIKWIVPYNAGGPSDVVARLIAEGLSTSLGQKVVVENRPGAGGTIGIQLLASSEPDGYTMATADNATLFNNWFLFDKLPYTPASFEYVATTGRLPLVLAVHQSVPATNFKEWQEWAKKNGPKTNYGTPGIGSPHHIALATLDDMLGLNMQHIAYKGDAAAIIDLVGGQIDTMLMGAAISNQYANDPRIRFLAVTWPKRLDTLKDVPTFDEVGLKDFGGWAEQGIIMPAGTPKNIVNRMNTEIGKVLQKPEVIRKLETFGMFPVISSPDEFKAYVDEVRPKAGEIIKRKGITIN